MNHVAPEEDRLQIPKAWTWRLLPRRGRRPEKPTPLGKPEAVDQLHQQILREERQLRAALAKPANQPFAEAGAAYLDGQADPRGAAAVAGLLLEYPERLCATHLRPEFDLWLRDHGLPFAVAAAVEMLTLDERKERWRHAPPIAGRVLVETDPSEIGELFNEAIYGGLGQVRSLLAAATDAEYAAVVSAVAECRDTVAKRITAMALLPDEHDWVLEACAGYGKVRFRDTYDKVMWLSVDTPEQVAAMGLTDMSDADPGLGDVTALLDGLGNDAFSILAASETSGNRHRDAVVQGIAVIPTDEAMAFLLEHLDRNHVFETAADAARRFPFRTLRIAAKLAPDAPAELRTRLAAVAALPDTDLHRHLSDEERAALADLAVTGGRVPDAAAEDLPPLLVSPPWNRKRPKAKAVVIDGLEAPVSQTRWPEGAKDSWPGRDAPDAEDLSGPMLSRHTARIAAERYARKDARPGAVAWFERHGLDTVPYLVPDALGSDKDRRKHAEAALLHLAAHHDPAAVAAGAESYGPEAARAIIGLIGDDPLEPRGVKVPKPPHWSQSMRLPQVLLKEGERALPHDSIPHLVTVLTLATPDYRYPGLDVVAETCDLDSLRRFSKTLFECWLAAGAPPKNRWALTQLAHFADEATVRTLRDLIRKWPGEREHRRAVTGLGVLGAIGTDDALRAVQFIADTVKTKAVKEEAVRQITRIAKTMGLSREQLADRLVPEFGLGDGSALVLDYGPRKFYVRFDERLQPFVTDEDGKPRKTLPKPGAKDDPETAAGAYRRFADLKKELRTVAASQVTRMETAMATARAWSPDEFRRYFTDHALNRHLARRLVWLADAEGSRFAFRIAEDGTFSDVEDDAVELARDATIRVAHPVHLGPEQTKAWAALLADYEIMQPFSQLDRPVMAFTEEEIATGRLARFEGAAVPIEQILGAVSRGWKRAKPEGGVEPGISRPIPGGHVTVSLEPGIWAGAVMESPEQRFAAVRLCDREYYWWAEAEPDGKHPKDLDPATASEILSWLTRITDTA